MTQLKKMRVVMKRAAPYVWFQGMLSTEKQASFIPQLEEEALPEPTLAGVLE
jgi:predicted DNA-binding helix-hairpin-helix protein